MLSWLDAEIARVAEVPRLLVATDFDGVLAPFVLDPMDARPQPGTLESIAQLAATPQTWTAVVSGRDLATLSQLTGLREGPTTLIGSHGAQSSRGDTALVDADAADRLAQVRAFVEAALLDQETQVAATGQAPLGIRLEHKPTALVLHTRDLSESAHACAAEVAREATQIAGVTLLAGKGVHELSVVQADKGTAVRSLAAELTVDAIVYLGDDVTDEHVFTVLAGRDLGIKVGPGESAARARLDDVGDVPALLARLAAHRHP